MKIQLSDHFSYKRLLRFVAPSILMLLCTSVYSIVDGFFVSNYVGKTPFAALNLVMPVLMGVGTLGFMAGTGGSAVVSMTLGEGKKELANEYFSLIVYVTLAVSIVVGFICFALAPQIALALGADGELEADCVRYSRILFLSSPAFVMQYLFQSFFIAAEKPALSLKVNVIAGLTNAVLDYVLIVVFPLGLVGAALATAAGQLVGGIIPVIYFFRENGSLLQLGKAKWHGKVIWQTVTNGSFELVTNISTSIVSILYNFQLMEAAGENGVAAYGIIMYVDIIFMTLYLGYSLGSAPIVSFHYGAGNHAELKNLCRKSLVIISACGVILLTASQILAGPLVKIFANYDQELLEMTTWGFRIYAIAFLVRGMNVWGSSFFTALNNGAVSAAISFLRTFAFQIVIVLILPKLIGITGVWLSIVLAEFLALFVTIGFLIAKRKQYHYA
jgi:MATE efflux family protein